MVFQNESDFEQALISLLAEKGWERDVIKNPTEKDLIQNWSNILYDNNKDINRLNHIRLTDGEMQQIMEQINTLRTPVKLNGFINGTTVTITRDNPKDTLHFGKEVSLKIYNRREIAAGQSRYQIVEQPKFPTKSPILNDRRGDLMLLINGMPVIHIELKGSGVPVSQAYHQIEKYAHEGIFTGLFSLVQIFVAMNPDDMRYFANPGPDEAFNEAYFFHWADFDNEPTNDWKTIGSEFLSIPMAHKLIGFYTVADNSDGVLKVMRSYQYYAANAISDKVTKTEWVRGNQRGGYVWHTTGSGKTMTSFKSAQLIASSKDADKVVFLTDRVELGTQSLMEYRGFALEKETVQATEDTIALINKLKSNSATDILIVTSIQKMSNIKEDGSLNAKDIETISSKRLVFIVDEAHRSTFGDMLMTIKHTFPRAIFFGFTGTPICPENQKKMNTTLSVFGNELHRYSIADGIRDKNVLGFDPDMVLTFKDKDIRKAVALQEAKASTEEEAIHDPKKAEVYYSFMNSGDIKMAGTYDENGKYNKGIEDYIPNAQYDGDEHRNQVVEDIGGNWLTLSRGGKFHAIFATSSISEAITYYQLMKEKLPGLKVTCLFDPSIDNNGETVFKEDGLVEILTDYNSRFGRDFSIPSYSAFKKDVAARLAHKAQYKWVDKTPEQELDILIVVDQMLTGFDSKWVNTLYLDKLLEYERVIQAFSRTNRLFGPDKPFGSIRYYRRPHTMYNNICAAVKLYSGDRPYGVFVEKIGYNLTAMNDDYDEIVNVFTEAGVPGLEKLPEGTSEKSKFAQLFRDLNEHLEAAKIQGFQWSQSNYEVPDKSDGADAKQLRTITIAFDETTYLTLAQRYKELGGTPDQPGGDGTKDVPYDLVGYLTEIDTGNIDTEYMNTQFSKYLKLRHQNGVAKEELDQALSELHKTFATLTVEEQKYADLFLHDVESGDVVVEEGKTFRDYVTEYMYKAQNDRIHKCASIFGLDEKILRRMMSLQLTETTINEFGRFDELKNTVDKTKAKSYFDSVTGTSLIPPKVNMKTDKLLREFVLQGGFDL